MKDFISKVTFGFLMAQLLPGAVVVIAFTCVMAGSYSGSDACLRQMLDCIENLWFRSTFTIVAFLFASVAVGMLIHGLNWTVLARLENRADPPISVRETRYHRWPFYTQLLLSPGIMVYEVFVLVARTSNIEQLTMDENISHIEPDYVQQFQLLQDFYLYFGQFYAHMAYAFLVTFILAILAWFRELTLKFLPSVLILYVLTAVFFLLGRVQLGSLFKAETILRSRSSNEEDEQGPTAGQSSN